IPYTLPTNPPINRVGYTEKQARLLLGKKITVLKLNSHFTSSSNLSQKTTFIKIILDNSNHLLGFHSLGFGVEEILIAIVLLMAEKKPLHYLFKLKFSHLNSLQILQHIKQSWLENNQKQNHIIINLSQTLFIWKRE
ncbi:hypothetical protein, partial [Geminocystis sp. GBBB08]|uniref:hypothetical protein n=1 Tax=Geminocystis sp. GBBB08 TaxID=2604140 RepID=UPI0027E3ACC3